MTERHAKGLAELAELSLAVARDLQARVAEAETPDEAAKLASGFHRIARTVRQTFALEARLQRDAIRGDREDADHARRQAERATSERRDRTRAQVGRLIWTEHEDDDDREDLVDDLEVLLDIDPEAGVAELCKELGLKNPPPQGEGDREAVVGVEAHSAHHADPSASPSAGDFNPLSPSGTAPPGEEHLEGAPDAGAGAHRPRRPIGLPGEFGPNGETGEHRLINDAI